MGNLFDTMLIISCHIIYDLHVVILYRNFLKIRNSMTVNDEKIQIMKMLNVLNIYSMQNSVMSLKCKNKRNIVNSQFCRFFEMLCLKSDDSQRERL